MYVNVYTYVNVLYCTCTYDTTYWYDILIPKLAQVLPLLLHQSSNIFNYSYINMDGILRYHSLNVPNVLGSSIGSNQRQHVPQIAYPFVEIRKQTT